MHVIMTVTIKLSKALEVLERPERLEDVYSAKSNVNRLIKSSS
jgi:energy-converting hydrogenase Eha subunit F